MAVLDFPSAPVYGQVYSKWTWDGGRWTCGLLSGPPPTITAIDPTEGVTGSAAFVLTVVGTNFLADSVINYGGQDQPTTFVDATTLVAQSVTPPAVDGTKMVYVRNGANVSTSVPIVFTTVTPDWVPAGALYHIDFVNELAWSNGAIVEINTLVGSDAMMLVNAGYDPANGLNGDGYSTFAANNLLIGILREAKEKILSGATSVMKLWASGEMSTSYLSPRWSDLLTLSMQLEPYYGTQEEALRLYNANGTKAGEALQVLNVMAGDINTVAMTMVPPLRLEAAANGTAAFSGDPLFEVPERPDYGTVVIDTGRDRIQTLTIYDPVAIEDLSAMTGVQAPPVGGEKPAWVREGALIAIDFRTPGKSWDGTTEGDGTTGIAALIGNDPDATNYAGATGYNASGLNAAGYDYQIVPGNTPAYIGALKTAVLGECSVVITIAGKTGAARHAPTVALKSADALAGIEVMTDGYDVTARSNTGSLNIRLVGCFIPPATEIYYRNRIGFTITATRFDIAANGFGSWAGVIDATDRPAENPFACVVEWGNDIEMIEVFPPCADVVALNTLTGL
jgi:hypothetical protein